MSLPSEQNWLIVFNLLTDLNKKVMIFLRELVLN